MFALRSELVERGGGCADAGSKVLQWAAIIGTDLQGTAGHKAPSRIHDTWRWLRPAFGADGIGPHVLTHKAGGVRKAKPYNRAPKAKEAKKAKEAEEAAESITISE